MCGRFRRCRYAVSSAQGLLYRVRVGLIIWLTIDHYYYVLYAFFFFFQAEDGIRDDLVTGVQTCALPISPLADRSTARLPAARAAWTYRPDTPCGSAESTTSAQWSGASSARSRRWPRTSSPAEDSAVAKTTEAPGWWVRSRSSSCPTHPEAPRTPIGTLA